MSAVASERRLSKAIIEAVISFVVLVAAMLLVRSHIYTVESNAVASEYSVFAGIYAIPSFVVGILVLIERVLLRAKTAVIIATSAVYIVGVLWLLNTSIRYLVFGDQMVDPTWSLVTNFVLLTAILAGARYLYAVKFRKP